MANPTIINVASENNHDSDRCVSRNEAMVREWQETGTGNMVRASTWVYSELIVQFQVSVDFNPSRGSGSLEHSSSSRSQA